MSMKLLMRVVLVFLSLSIYARPAKLSVSFGPGRFGSSISRQPLIPLKNCTLPILNTDLAGDHRGPSLAHTNFSPGGSRYSLRF